MNNLKSAFNNIGDQVMTILNSQDIAKVQVELCAIKNCDRPAIGKFREISEMFNVCEFHETIMDKHRGED